MCIKNNIKYVVDCEYTDAYLMFNITLYRIIIGMYSCITTLCAARYEQCAF